MLSNKNKIQTVEEYTGTFPESVQEILEKIRQTIREAAPDASEVISYKMPAFRTKGILVWYGAFKNHIGFFPTSKAIVVFKKELSQYKTSKGTIQFPLEKPLPLSLIKKIVKFRVKEVLKKNNI